MIVADASAICAILLKEPDDDVYTDVLADSDGFYISAVNAWEVAVRVDWMEADGGAVVFDEFSRRFGGQVVPVGDQDWRAAFAVWRRFGKSCHPARLNLADCFAYALADSRRLPLLYKGDDFPQTDIASAL